MVATGVVVVTNQSARHWVGHQPACKAVLRELREVRSVERVVVCNFTGAPLPVEPDAEVVLMEQSWAGPPPMHVLHAAVAKRLQGYTLVCCHAATPLVPAAAIEQCAEAVLGGATAAMTVKTVKALVPAPGQWSEAEVPVPVQGVLAFDAGLDWGRFPSGVPADKLVFVPVTRKHALSLADEGDLELLQALEFAGRI